MDSTAERTLAVDAMFKAARSTDAYEIAEASLDFAESINRWIKFEGISRKEFASRIGSSPAYVTQLLRGDANFTISTMVKACRALGAKLHIHLAREGAVLRWLEIYANRRDPKSFSGEGQRVISTQLVDAPSYADAA